MPVVSSRYPLRRAATVICLAIVFVARTLPAAPESTPTPADATPVPAAPAARPTPPTDPFDRLQVALDAERDHRKQEAQSKKKKEARNSAERNAADYHRQKSEDIQHVRNSPEGGKESLVNALIKDLRSSARFNELREVCDDLSDQAEKKQEAEDAAYNTRVDDALRTLGALVLRAKEPKELDPPIRGFTGMLNSAPAHNGSRDVLVTRTTGRLSKVATFLHLWQDYLQALARKDSQASAFAMRSISNMTGPDDAEIVPRSEILARLPDEPKPRAPLIPDESDEKTAAETRASLRKILTDTRTLDDIQAALGKIDELKKKPVRNPSFNAMRSGADNAVSILEELQTCRRGLQDDAEVSISIPQAPGQGSNWTADAEGDLARLRAELLVLALPRVLGAGDDTTVPGERLDACLQRLAELARKRGDWDATLRAVELSRKLGPAPGAYTPADLSNENEAFRQFRVGQTMETAGQAQQAAAAYLLALKTGVQDLPVSLIGDHLARIKKEHPEDYAAANAFVLNQPAVTPKPANTPEPNAGFSFRAGTDPFNSLIAPRLPPPYVLAVPAKKAG